MSTSSVPLFVAFRRALESIFRVRSVYGPFVFGVLIATVHPNLLRAAQVTIQYASIPSVPGTTLHHPTFQAATSPGTYCEADLVGTASGAIFRTYAHHDETTDSGTFAGASMEGLQITNVGTEPVTIGGPDSPFFAVVSARHSRGIGTNGIAGVLLRSTLQVVDPTCACVRVARADFDYSVLVVQGSDALVIEQVTPSGESGGSASILAATDTAFAATLWMPAIEIGPGQSADVFFELRTEAGGSGVDFTSTIDAVNPARIRLFAPAGSSLTTDAGALPWITVPEPSLAAMLAAGLLIIAFHGRRGEMARGTFERHRIVSVGIPIGLALGFAATASAVDGVIEINQASALAGGITPGDAAGFPVSLTQRGAYRLTSNLALPDENTPGITVTMSDVTIDLNGFAIVGPVQCTPVPVGFCSPAGSGGGVGIQGPDHVTVRNGKILGTGGEAISLAWNARIEGVDVTFAAPPLLSGAIRVGDESIVSEVAVTSSLRSGILVGSYSIVRDSTSTGNSETGILAGSGSLVRGCTSSRNVVGVGFFGAGPGAYESNSISNNTNATVNGSAVNLGGNLCNTVLCP